MCDGLTTEQYHACVAQLWDALGGERHPLLNVFGLAVGAIRTGPELERICRNQFNHGSLVKVQLAPCHCGRWAVDEWYQRMVGLSFHKEHSAVEVTDLNDARAIYRRVFPRLHEAHYLPKEDTYTSKDPFDNFIVTGSHCFCKECRS